MKKIIALYRIGEEDLKKGMNILCAHMDSPRLDIKQNPLYEDSDFAYLDTHYYGGIKKYQWVALPLALHGVVAKKDGTVVESLHDRIVGRYTSKKVINPETKELIIDKNEMINENIAKKIVKAGIKKVESRCTDSC